MRSDGKPIKRYDGKIAVVTGASSGIGRRLAFDLAERGATVVGLARRQELLAEVETLLRSSTPDSSTRVCDVGETASFQHVLHEIEEQHGRIDVLINDAGIEQLTPVEEGLSPAYRQIFDVNVFGVMAGTLAVLPGMLEQAIRDRRERLLGLGTGSGARPRCICSVQGRRRCVYRVGGPRGRRPRRPRSCALPGLGADGHGDVGDRRRRIATTQGRSGRSEAQVSDLVLGRMGGRRMEINAAVLPLLAPIGRSIAPVSYQKAMRHRAR